MRKGVSFDKKVLLGASLQRGGSFKDEDVLVYVVEGPGHKELLSLLLQVNREHGYDDVLPDPPEGWVNREYSVLRNSEGAPGRCERRR